MKRALLLLVLLVAPAVAGDGRWHLTRVLSEPPPRRPAVDFIHFAPDGKTVLLASGRHVVERDAETLTELRSVTLDGRLLAISDAGSGFVAIEGEGVVHVDRGTVFQHKRGRGNAFGVGFQGSVLAFGESHLFVGDANGTWVDVYDLGGTSRGGVQVAAVADIAGIVPIGSSRAVVCGSGFLRVIEATTHVDVSGERLSSSVQTIAGIPGTLRIVHLADHQLQILEVARDGSFLIVHREFEPTVQPPLAVSPGGDLLVVADDQDRLHVYDARTLVERAKLVGHLGRITAIAISPDGKHVVSASADGTTRLWDLGSATSFTELHGHIASVSAIALSKDSRFALTGSADTTLCLWDLSSGQCLTTLQGHFGMVCSVSFSPDGKTATSTADHAILTWDLEKKRPIDRKTRNPALVPAKDWRYLKACKDPDDFGEVLANSPDGKLTLTSRRRGALLWTVGIPEPVERFDLDDRATAAAFVSDDSVLVGTASGRLLRFDR